MLPDPYCMAMLASPNASSDSTSNCNSTPFCILRRRMKTTVEIRIPMTLLEQNNKTQKIIYRHPKQNMQSTNARPRKNASNKPVGIEHRIRPYLDIRIQSGNPIGLSDV